MPDLLAEFKAIWREQLGLPSWMALMLAGLALHLVLNTLLHKQMTAPAGLIAPAAAGLAIEGYEIWSRYRCIGLFAPGNDPFWVIALRHAGDIALMLVLPVILVVLHTMRHA